MSTLNQLTIIGFTGNEAHIQYMTSGTLVATLSVATKQSWKDAEGARQSRTDWHRVVRTRQTSRVRTHDSQKGLW
jgi:single-strand DNA-binding protein